MISNEIITIDSSVFIAAFREKEDMHKECAALFERVVRGDWTVVVPYSVLIEVTAAVKRRTGSESFAKIVFEQLCNISSLIFFDLVKSRAVESCDLAVRSSMKGMDLLVVQIAEEMGSILVTLDKEMMERAGKFVKIKSVGEILGK